MNKLFCDECDDHILTSIHEHTATLEDNKKERNTEVSFLIKGVRYKTKTDSPPKSDPIEHICQKCAIKKVKLALKQLESGVE